MDMPNAEYGENAQFREVQQGAPVAKAESAQAVAAQAMSSVIGLGEPSLEPDVPVTSGAEYGLGPGQDALGLEDLDQMDADEFAKLKPMLIRRAMRDDTPKSVKVLIRRLLAR